MSIFDPLKCLTKTTPLNKTELRIKYTQLREELTVENIDDYSLALTNKVLQLPIWQHCYYHLFLTISEKKEIDTSFLLSVLFGKDKDVIVSKTNFKEGTLTNYLLTENTPIKKNKWNIPEPIDGIEVPPSKIDVVFIPLLAFDKQGNRLGYGKGFYDKFLAECKPDVVKIGLSLFEAEDNKIDTLTTDIPLDFCVTPNSIYKF